MDLRGKISKKNQYYSSFAQNFDFLNSNAENLFKKHSQIISDILT